MSTYLVRMAGSRELVGLFWADSLSSLAHVVDECVSPSLCEAKNIRLGGIFWPMPIEVCVPLPDESGGDDEGSQLDVAREKLPEPVFSDLLYCELFEESGRRALGNPRYC